MVGDAAAGGAGGLAAQRAGVVGLVREVLSSCGGAGAGGGDAAGAGGAAAGQQQQPPLRLGLLAAAVRCGGAWVRLDDSGAAGCGMSPGELEVGGRGVLGGVQGCRGGVHRWGWAIDMCGYWLSRGRLSL